MKFHFLRLFLFSLDFPLKTFTLVEKDETVGLGLRRGRSCCFFEDISTLNLFFFALTLRSPHFKRPFFNLITKRVKVFFLVFSSFFGRKSVFPFKIVLLCNE
jgi:hypothetical protein